MDINATFIGQALAFAILIWFSYKFVWPPLTNAIDERQKRIAEGLAAAERSKKELAQAEDKVNELLKEARAKANEIIDQAHQRGNQIVEHAKLEAVAEANRQKAVAQAEIEVAANRAREQLRAEFAAVAIAGAERLLKREIDPAAHRALLEEFAAEL